MAQDPKGGRKRPRISWGTIVVVAFVAVGWLAYERLFRQEIPRYEDLAEHFKYGAIGNHAENGLPFAIWSSVKSAGNRASRFSRLKSVIFGMVLSCMERRAVPVLCS